jgi:murein DD-endopeptidase MepM/ murein hydrolase activator NlpD
MQFEQLRFEHLQFHPVVKFGESYEVYDFSKEYDPMRPRTSAYGVGKYNEHRPQMYKDALFAGVRTVHMGIDLAAPALSNVYSFYDGELYLFADNSQPGDYGPTLVTRHLLDGVEIFALFGHLSRASLLGKKVGDKFATGDVIATLGLPDENGGWNPHLHFQLAWRAPKVADMPGVVSLADRAEALKLYPDPRLVLGNLY